MMVLAHRNSQPESRDFWKHELTQAVNEIRQMYDDKVAGMRTQMESSYDVKVVNVLSCPKSSALFIAHEQLHLA